MKKIVKAVWRLNYGANVEFEGSTQKKPDFVILPNEAVFRLRIKVGSEFDTETQGWFTPEESPEVDLGEQDDEALKKAFEGIGAKLGQEKKEDTPPPPPATLGLKPEVPEPVTGLNVPGLTIAPTTEGGE